MEAGFREATEREKMEDLESKGVGVVFKMQSNKKRNLQDSMIYNLFTVARQVIVKHCRNKSCGTANRGWGWSMLDQLL